MMQKSAKQGKSLFGQRTINTDRRILLIMFVLLPIIHISAEVSNGPEYQEESQKLYYAVEIGNVLCGYYELDIDQIKENGQSLTRVIEKGTILQSILGGEYDIDMKLLFKIAPETGRYTYMDSDIRHAGIQVGSRITVNNQSATHVRKSTDESKDLLLSDDILLDNGYYYSFLLKDLNKDLREKTYEVLETTEGKIQIRTYKLLGKEKLKLKGHRYSAVKYHEFHKSTGITASLWIDKTTGLLLQRVFSNGFKTYISNKSVIKKTKTANIDDAIFIKVNELVSNAREIAYMKISCQIRAPGEQLSSEKLNVPGQKFTGTVKDNIIDGVFEISYNKYDGSSAPAFPAYHYDDHTLQIYLEPENLIESDSPSIIRKAEEITRGAEDSWEAVIRIVGWVAKNINYDIPGGISAIKTYETGFGECSAHSRLVTAFCRSVGIPARMVIGAIYTDTFGGSFGQHAWSEVYMGKTGWVPVDATAFEVDFIDSGHLRLGENTSFNPVEMKIIDYRMNIEDNTPPVNIPADFEPYTGDYILHEANIVFNISYKDNGLIVDIPGQMKIPLNKPDENDFWYSSLSNHIYFSFGKNDSGKVENMHFFQVIPASKKSSPLEINENVPEAFRPYLGEYYFAQIRANLKIIYKEGSLAIDDPSAGMVIKLQAPDEDGKWMDEFNKNGIKFKFDEEGKISRLTICSETILQKK